MQEPSHLACYFTRRLRCVSRGIALAMQRKPRLVDTQNSGAILQHSTHDRTLAAICAEYFGGCLETGSRQIGF